MPSERWRQCGPIGALRTRCTTSLDVVFQEDDARVRIKNAAENLALIRKITHNLLAQEQTLKRGIKTKRLMASWDRNYLLKVIGLIPSDP